MVIVGIDPGLQGGICVVKNDTEILWMSPMPLDVEKEVDFNALKDIFRDLQFNFKPDMFIVEKVSCRPGEGGARALKMGTNFGVLIGMLTMLGCRFEQIRPQKWSKHLPPVMKEENESKEQHKRRCKERNRQKALQLFPQHDFLATKRSKMAHLGLVDAVLIAVYGRDR